MKPILHPRRSNDGRGASLRRDAGSVLLVMLFLLAAMVIAMGIAAPKIAQQIKRDREVEMIHRGEQYARAIKRYYRKTGRYPGRIEDLENTNNIRFLRKRYKDPMSPDGNWRLVRFGEVQLGQSGAGAGNVGIPAGAAGNSGSTATADGASSGSDSSSSSSFGNMGKSSSGFGSGFGSSGSSLFGSGSNTGSSSFGAAGTSGTTGQSSSIFGGGGTTGGQGQVFGGGAIVGVASTSEKKGIHEFNNKSQYNQWLFVYDPTQDPTGTRLIKGPYNPKAFVGSAQSGIGQPIGQPGGLGNPSPLGQPGGLGNPLPQGPQQQNPPNR